MAQIALGSEFTDGLLSLSALTVVLDAGPYGAMHLDPAGVQVDDADHAVDAFA